MRGYRVSSGAKGSWLGRFALGAFCVLLGLPVAKIARAQQYPESMYQAMRWRLIGPFRGGRTRAATGVPSQPNVFYVGQVDGGVWKSDDYGRTWNPIFDNEPTQSIGAIAVAPSDPNVIYVGSGEGLHRPDLSVGDGIYKSTDSGKTWTHLGLSDGEQIPTLAVDPRDPNRVFAAVLGHPFGPNAERGIFRSTDGGQNWQKVLYKDESTGGCDVEIDHANPDVVYATLWEERMGPWEDANQFPGPNGGIFKSTDGGTTWNQLTQGLPKGLTQAYVTISPTNPQRLYASVAAGYATSIYRSDDAGASWSKSTDDPRPSVRIGGGDLAMPRVDPRNPDVVYTTSTVTWRSTDGGKTWTGIRGAPGGDDYQNMWINPNNPDVILLVSDQGAIVSVNGGDTWSSWYNQPTAQFYHVITDNRFPYWVYGAQQESGSAGVASRGNDGEITFREFHPVGVIEYGYVAPDPLHPEIVYGAGRTEVSKFNWVTGQVQNVTPIPVRDVKYRGDRTEPVMFSPVDPHIMYYATNSLFKTTDGGNSWTTISPDLSRPEPGVPSSVGNMAAKNPEIGKTRGVIYALAPSFKDVNTLWAGTDDGQVWITHDGGKNWKNITPPKLTPWSKVSQISASHFDEQTAFVSVSRFRIDDLKPYIYRTQDGGKTWQLITNGLPDNSPVDTVREDPVRKGLLFAGTETAVWVSFDGGGHWQSLQLNLPHTSMRDLWIHDSDLIVATHGRSFWILDDIAPLRQMAGAAAHSAPYLFKPALAYRVKRDTNTDTPLPPDEPAGQNPPDGAVIDYYLPQAASGAVTLEILDSGGKVVRRYASTDKPEFTMDELRKTLAVPIYWVKMPQILSAEAGMHRWVWDLHYPPPPSNRHGYPISAVPHDTPREPLGPTALPGQYSVKLTVEGHSYTAPLTVKMDPRVKTSPVGLQQQFRAEQRLAALMASDYQAAGEARAVQSALQKLNGKASGPLAEAVSAFQRKLRSLAGAPGGFFAPPSREVTLARASGDAAGLYGIIGGADAAPTAAQTAGLAQVERESAEVSKRWNEIKSRDIPALNRQLSGAGLPEVHVEAQPQPEEESGDVE
ncbi:MAG TPA: glycoside hydrolase [Terriglobia bacterium]|nr:glycoside hydrolase [Terriglobia bacterium]